MEAFKPFYNQQKIPLYLHNKSYYTACILTYGNYSEKLVLFLIVPKSKGMNDSHALLSFFFCALKYLQILVPLVKCYTSK